MSKHARAIWEKAGSDLAAARLCLPVSPDSAASRAYYAAFHAVSALFMLRGQTFTKHTAVEAAVHRDLVKPGTWSQDVGAAYTRLMQLRQAGDYAASQGLTPEQAREAIEPAERVLLAVAGNCGNAFLDIPSVQ